MTTTHVFIVLDLWICGLFSLYSVKKKFCYSSLWATPIQEENKIVVLIELKVTNEENPKSIALKYIEFFLEDREILFEIVEY